MKSKKLSMLITMGAVVTTIVLSTPAISSFATTVNGVKTENGQAVKADNNTGNQNTDKKEVKKVTLEQVNIFTGKVVKNSEVNAAAPSSFAVTFNGPDHMTYYNNKNLEPNTVQTKFHSKTQATLYNYLMNPNNRWNAENEAIGLHNGDAANTCVFFVSSALRGIGVNIPDSIGYTTNLMNELQSLGWEKETDLSTLEPGDICFASTAHTYVFMGWANKAEGIAWIADNQFTWFGTDFHPRTQASVPDVDVSPTTCYYRLPGSYSIDGNSKQIDMPANYNYGLGVVEVQGLHIRQQPSTNSQILADLNYGQRIEILSQDGNWFKIMYNGQPAYVWANSVSGSAPSVTEPYNAHYKVIGTGTVDFKDGSYTDITSSGTWYSNVRGTLNNGTKVSIIDQNANWYQIEYETGTAWIPKDRLNTTLNHKVIGTGVVAFSDLSYTDIMSGGTWNSNFVGTLNNGTKVNIIGQNDNWFEIETGNGTAWILKNRLSTSLGHKVIGAGIVAFSDLSYTDIMSGGTWNSNFVGTLNNGTKVNIIGQNDNWFEIETGNGTAWILKNRLSTSLGHEVIGTGTVAFNDLSYTDIMSGGTWNSNFVGTLNNGTKVNIIGQNDNWFEIETGNGTAWILKDRLNTTLGHKVIGTGKVAFNELSYTDITSKATWYSNVVGTLNNGTNVNIIGKTADWYEIEYNNGTAWIPKDRLNTSLNENYKVIGTGKVAFNELSYTDITSKATWYSDVVGTLNNGTNINIIGQTTDWYEIEYNNGTAWILKSRVNKN